MDHAVTEVRSGGKVVGSVEYRIFSTVDEAQELLGEAECLSLINAGEKTNARNRKRSEAIGKPTKETKTLDLIQEIALTEEFRVAQAEDEAAKASGNSATKVIELVRARLEEMRAKKEAEANEANEAEA